MSPTWRRLRPKVAYDWMLIGSYVFGHHARLLNVDVPKFVYAHTPARYIWHPELDERGAHPAVRAVSPMYRQLDQRYAQEATALAANSHFVRERIQRAWGRDAVVIHPPVAVDRIQSVDDWRANLDGDGLRAIDVLPDTFVLGASRFVPYKRLDSVIRAAASAKVPAVIAGSGPDEARLRDLAARLGARVTFVISPTDALMYALMQQAAAFVFPAVEDFGIVPVEAQAAGTPVVTGPVGGQLETFKDGVTGIIASSTEASDLATAINAAIALSSFEPRAATAGFSEQVFAIKIRDFVQSNS